MVKHKSADMYVGLPNELAIHGSNISSEEDRCLGPCYTNVCTSIVVRSVISNDITSAFFRDPGKSGRHPSRIVIIAVTQTFALHQLHEVQQSQR